MPSQTLTPAQRAGYAVEAAAVSLNNDLTILQNGIQVLDLTVLPNGIRVPPAALLHELAGAVERCALRTALLLMTARELKRS